MTITTDMESEAGVLGRISTIFATSAGAYLRPVIRTALIALAFAGSAVAQEGHPLKGSWIGTWEGNETHGESVLLVLDWDGQNITGVINPGTDNISITNASLEPKEWTVTLEADGKDPSGADVHYVIEGRIENLELPSRSIVGTWKHQRGGGAFAVSRQ